MQNMKLILGVLILFVGAAAFIGGKVDLSSR
jgi:hypothetical protein